MQKAIRIQAGAHARRNCPVQIRVEDLREEGFWILRSADGIGVPLQRIAVDTFAFEEPLLEAGEERTYRLEELLNEPAAAVTLDHEAGHSVEVRNAGELVTSYVYGGTLARPYFYPVFAPHQVPLTRSFPLEANYRIETNDHPHHKSVWIAFGDVNGVDNWSEDLGHGTTRTKEVTTTCSGPVAASFKASSLWLDSAEAPILTERLAVTFWAGYQDCQLIDFDIQLVATHGDVRFGDTKEGGVLSVRVAGAMDVQRGGTIRNSFGGVNEAETWGKPAHWCSYSGRVDGWHTTIGVLDHPSSFRHPTTWHVRDYGLMTANPFGYAAFTAGRLDGSFLLTAGSSLHFRYRLVLYAGCKEHAGIADLFMDYASPPAVSIQ